jgi:23S rRNA (cytidine2498-2'-O)-methyltransferase
MLLYADDIRRCPAGFALARTVEDCLLMLRECEVEVLSLDYDFGPGQPNGVDLAVTIVRERLYPARSIYLHSSSPAGRQRMYHILYAARPNHVSIYNHPMQE